MTKQPVDFCQVAIVQRTPLLGNGSKVTSTSRKGPIRASSKIWSSQIPPFTAVSPLWESGLVPFAKISSSSALHLSLTSSSPNILAKFQNDPLKPTILPLDLFQSIAKAPPHRPARPSPVSPWHGAQRQPRWRLPGQGLGVASAPYVSMVFVWKCWEIII